MIRAVHSLIELVYPVMCVGCHAPGSSWCEDCRSPPGPQWVHSVPGLDVVASGEYTGSLRQALLAYKERGNRALGTPLAGRLSSAVTVLGHGVGALDSVLVPITSRRAVARQRGGDHMLRLARIVGVETGASVVRALQPTSAAVDSAGLTAAQRAMNQAGQMVARAPGIIGSPAILIDDIVTTGATLAEAARALECAGWNVLGAATVAATRRRRPTRSRPRSL